MADEQIRQGLLQAGWQANDVNEAMMSVPVFGYPQTQPKPKVMMPKSLAIIFITISVAVAGYFAGAYYASKLQNFPLWPFEAPAEPVPSFTPRPRPLINSGQLDISSWQTYHNEEYGFEVKYPSDWGFSKQESFNEPAFVISRDESRLAILPKAGMDYGPPFEDPVVSEITVAGRKAELTRWINIGENGELKLYHFIEIPKAWGNIHRLDLLAVNENDLKILDQILSTFKFIE